MSSGPFGTCSPQCSVKTDASAHSRPSISNMHFLWPPQMFTFLEHLALALQRQHRTNHFDLGFPRLPRPSLTEEPAGCGQTQDLLTHAVNKHNRQTVGKSKLKPDEVSAIHFFDQAPASLQRLLKIVSTHGHHSSVCQPPFPESEEGSHWQSQSPGAVQPTLARDSGTLMVQGRRVCA